MKKIMLSMMAGLIMVSGSMLKSATFIFTSQVFQRDLTIKIYNTTTNKYIKTINLTYEKARAGFSTGSNVGDKLNDSDTVDIIISGTFTGGPDKGKCDSNVVGRFTVPVPVQDRLNLTAKMSMRKLVLKDKDGNTYYSSKISDGGYRSLNCPVP